MQKIRRFPSLVFYALFVCLNVSDAQDTFSIVAIDTVTKEVGSAGASFVANVPHDLVNDIFNVLPGVGAIHTQALYNENNQKLANELMNAGFSPQEIVDCVVQGESEKGSAVRQYIIVDLVNGGRTAAFTGRSCLDYANHILGKNYAIAGNILYGQDVLDNMEAGFLNTEGSLADKLMAAMQGGRKAGGDKRGERYGVSSLVAALKVAKPNNSKDSLYLDLFVAYPNALDLLHDPVDSLQILFNEWRGEPTNVTANLHQTPDNYCLYQNYPNPFNPETQIRYDVLKFSETKIEIHNALGQHVNTLVNREQSPGHYQIIWNGTDENGRQVVAGIYLCRMTGDRFEKTIKLVLVK